ncbi:MAG: hypothetical protein HKP38_03805 [Croceitalea sp.]|nr:hypothetical protein [Croceitalea sp.]NNL08329.1 hypothetical protein [Croceitalea sp.]
MIQAFFKRQTSFLLKLGLLALLLFAVHWWVISNFFNAVEFFFPLWQIYAFHFVTVLILFTIINYKFSQGGGAILNYFLVATILKMLLCIVFLLPLLLSDFQGKRPDVLNFFFPYFTFLFFEVFSLNLLLTKK